MFSQAVIEELDYYVYYLQDPKTNEIFYIGKGKGNRVFDHVACAIETDGNSEKLDKIRAIKSAGDKVKHFILRHGLINENMAFEIEAALIDFVGKDNLSNLQSGRYSSDDGLKTTDEISAMYAVTELATNEPILLININKLYRRDMTVAELYEATRKSWVLGTRRNKAKYAVATYRGLTREVYKIDDWDLIDSNSKKRWGFNGSQANEYIRKNLRHKSIKSFFKKGAANPIRYLNC